MAILSVKDQYYLYIKISEFEDFLKNGGSLIHFIIQESSGGDLPLFEMHFRSNITETIVMVNEGNKISCRFGISEKDAVDVSMVIQKVELNRDSDNFISFIIKGFIGNHQFLNESKIEGFKNKKSVDVIKKTTEDCGFNYKAHKTGIDPTNDTQNWIRYNQSPKSFIENTWKRSYVSDDDFLVYCINKESTLVLAQYSKIALAEPKWVLDVNGLTENSIVYNSDYVIRNNSGLNNMIGVYNRERNEINIESGEISKIKTPNKKPILASSKTLNIPKDEPTSFLKNCVKDDNTHSNYNISVLNNFSKVILHGTTEIEVVLASKFLPFEIFDTVLFLNDPIDKKEQSDIGMIAGNYIITEIRRFFHDNVFGTSLVLSRDSLNELEGDLK